MGLVGVSDLTLVVELRRSTFCIVILMSVDILFMVYCVMIIKSTNPIKTHTYAYYDTNHVFPALWLRLSKEPTFFARNFPFKDIIPWSTPDRHQQKTSPISVIGFLQL